MSRFTSRAARLAAEVLTAPGVDPAWAAVIAHVPRHIFVPSYYPSLDTAGEEPPRLLHGADPENHDEWLDMVYSDRSLVTQCALTPGTTNLWQSTSSSTRPSLMARMLTLLDARPGRRILEIGTGTGYNAALIGRRLGSSGLTTIDLDPALVILARERLALCGHHPTVVAGDGSAGVEAHAPYDRILATCAVPEPPSTWGGPARTGRRHRGRRTRGSCVEPPGRSTRRRQTDRHGALRRGAGPLHVAPSRGRQPASGRRHLRHRDRSEQGGLGQHPS